MPEAQPTPSDFDAARYRVATNVPWLVKLRWVAVVGQLVTIGFVRFGLEIDLPIVPLTIALGVTASTNFALWIWLRKLVDSQADGPRLSSHGASAVVAIIMLLDLVVLTAMLFVTGGSTNPFMVFYLVNLALAGVLLEPAFAWMLEGVAIIGLGLLYWNHWQVPVLQEPERLIAMSSVDGVLPLAVMGDFIAFVACSGVIVAFMTRLTTELRESESARRRAEDLRSRSEKLEALGTLAAGAAHELATPLSTIAVVATEVERELSSRDLPDDIAEDLRLIRSELERCRSILDRMALDSGQMIREAAVEVSAENLVDAILADLPNASRVRFGGTGAHGAKLRLPMVSVSQALRGLVQNALDAHPDTPVQLTVTTRDGRLLLRIVDHGPGMPAEILSRAGEPFFTTKEPGQGMGLGIFLARSVIERVGGTLQLSSQAGSGTEVMVELPLAGK